MASKYVTISNIQHLVAKIKAGFAAIGHKHTAGDITAAHSPPTDCPPCR